MQKSLLIVFLIVCLGSDGQQGKFIPFKLLVIKPDTAVIDKSLYADIDSVQNEYAKRYYNNVNQLEELVSSAESQTDSASRASLAALKSELAAAKSAEPEVSNFKYYHTLSLYSADVYSFYFNEYEPFSTFVELPYQHTDIMSLNKLSDSLKADYVVFYTDIHTENKYGLPVLKVTTSLFSRKHNRVIFTKKTEGDTNSRGDMWTCGNTTLSCLLINSVRTSTDQITAVLVKEQMKR